MSFLGKLVSGKELIGVKKRRSQPYGFEKFEYELQAIRESEGWIVDRKLKSAVRIKKLKPLPERFENEAWCLFTKHINPYKNVKGCFCGTLTFTEVVGLEKSSLDRADIAALRDFLIRCKK